MSWDDGSDDEWDVDDEALEARLKAKTSAFQEEEDLAVKEREEADRRAFAENKKKGQALAEKKRLEAERLEDLEIARRQMELEAEAEANMSPEELRAYKQKKIEEADNALTDDLFGAVEAMQVSASNAATGASDKLVLKDLKDHLKHARKVGEAVRAHGKIMLTTEFLKELLSQCKDVLDDDAITDLIKTMNVIKNEKVQQAKRKVKGQAQKSKKADKKAEAKIRQKMIETFGDNDKYDDIDDIGAQYEDEYDGMF